MSLYDRLWYWAHRSYSEGIDPPPEFVEITNDNVDEVVEYYRSGVGTVAIDTETYGSEYQRSRGRRYAGDALHQVYAQISCLGFYDGVRLFAARRSQAVAIRKVLDALKGWTLVFWNAVFDRAMMRNSGFPLDHRTRDCQVRKWLICHRLSDKAFGEMKLSWFVENLLKGQKGSFREEVGMDVTLEGALTTDQWDRLLKRVAGDSYYTYYTDALVNKVLPVDIDREYWNVEDPMQDVIMDMERQGVVVDVNACIDIHGALMNEAKELERALQRRVLKHIDEPININSPKQLGHYFYDALGYEAPDRADIPDVKSETDRPTAASVMKIWMKKHLCEEAALVLDIRKVTKLSGTYIIGPGKDIDDNGRIYPKTNQTGTATGRFNMERPSLHNLPVREDKPWLEILKGFFCDEDREEEFPEDLMTLVNYPTERYGLRKIYVPAEGNVFIGADYSQIELRILAHFSDDATLLDVFRTGKDPHSATGASLAGMEYEDFAKKLKEKDKECVRFRNIGKMINFAILYGAGPYRLASQLGISLDKAEEMLNRYRIDYPDVFALKDAVINYLERKGEVRTLLRRVRPISVFQKSFSFDLEEDLSDFEDAVRGYGAIKKGEREGFNAVIQGSAADIIKLAMIKLYQDSFFAQHARIVLSIHDEIIAETKAEMGHEVAARMVEVMKNVPVEFLGKTRLD